MFLVFSTTPDAAPVVSGDREIQTKTLFKFDQQMMTTSNEWAKCIKNKPIKLLRFQKIVVSGCLIHNQLNMNVLIIMVAAVIALGHRHVVVIHPKLQQFDSV